jgi:hypothetical protein
MRKLSRRNFGKWVIRGGILVPFTSIIVPRAASIIVSGNSLSAKPIAAAGGGGGNDIAFRSKNQVIGTGGNATVTEPGSAAANDVFVAVAICANAATLTRPTGWTPLYSGTSGTSFKYDVSYIRRGGSAPSLVWTIGSSVYREVHVMAYSGVDTTTAIDAQSTGVVNNSTNPDPDSVTTTAANSMVVIVGINWNGSSPSWAHAAYTIRSDNTAGNDVVMAELKKATAGAENPANFTGAPFGADQFAASVALKD